MRLWRYKGWVVVRTLWVSEEFVLNALVYFLTSGVTIGWE